MWTTLDFTVFFYGNLPGSTGFRLGLPSFTDSLWSFNCFFFLGYNGFYRFLWKFTGFHQFLGDLKNGN